MSGQKENYQKELEQILENIKHSHESEKSKPTLLLHACCAPCSSYVLEYLSSIFDITIFYYNPNIHPQQEYDRRLSELEEFLLHFPPAISNQVKLVTDSYDPEEYFAATKTREESFLQAEHERGERCRRCYQFRMKKAYAYACTHQFDWFTTTLSISPYKDADKINTIGKELQEKEKSAGNYYTRFLTSDFKKKNGFLRSLKLSTEYNLYRQNYCGCIYSLQAIK